MNEEEIHSSEPFWSQRPTKVYLTINHPEFSSAMAGLLHGRSDLNIVGRANTIQKTLFELQKIEVDVLVLDICMGEEGSLEAVQGIRQLHPKIKILVTTDGGHEDQQVASILARADGFLYKPLDFAKAIRLVQDGNAFFDYVAMREALNPPPPVQPTSLQPLSEKDYEYLEMVRQGLSNAQIAEKLKVRPKSIYQLRFRLRKRLHLRSTRDLITFSRTARELMNAPGSSPFKRVLIVDDDPMILQSVKITLSAAGFWVDKARDAGAALKLIAEATFDVIIADMRFLIGAEGEMLRQKIKSRDPSERAVLLRSKRADLFGTAPSDVFPTEFDAMLIKPFSVAELRKAVAY